MSPREPKWIPAGGPRDLATRQKTKESPLPPPHANFDKQNSCWTQPPLAPSLVQTSLPPSCFCPAVRQFVFAPPSPLRHPSRPHPHEMVGNMSAGLEGRLPGYPPGESAKDIPRARLCITIIKHWSLGAPLEPQADFWFKKWTHSAPKNAPGTEKVQKWTHGTPKVTPRTKKYSKHVPQSGITLKTSTVWVSLLCETGQHHPHYLWRHLPSE